MERIVFTAQITFVDEKGKEVKLETSAGSAEKLFKRLKDVLDEESKWTITKLFSLT